MSGWRVLPALPDLTSGFGQPYSSTKPGFVQIRPAIPHLRRRLTCGIIGLRASGGMADTHALGACAARREGSNLSSPTAAGFPQHVVRRSRSEASGGKTLLGQRRPRVFAGELPRKKPAPLTSRRKLRSCLSVAQAAVSPPAFSRRGRVAEIRRSLEGLR